MADIIIDHVTKRFGTFTAVDDLDIRFSDGDVTCLLGPSGCGKTTLMRMIAGLETPSSGRILFGERDVTQLPPRKRNIGMVFQYPVMYPTLSVAENIAQPLKHDRSLSRGERERRVEEVLDLLDMRKQARAFIDDLDAGSRQKVAVGRSVARQTDIVLFDEPTTNVEVNAKLQLIRTFKAVTQRLKQTIVYVTHDQTEAMTLADRIALMKDGSIVQYDAPRRLYNDPSTEFGGWFLGNPGMNFIAAERRGNQLHATILDSPLDVASDLGGGEIVLGIRPENVLMHSEPGPGSVEGRVTEQTIGIAGRNLARIAVGSAVIKVKADGPAPVAADGTVQLSFPRDRILVFRNGARVTL
ncbi:ABC transporter ATP-binding protein [Pelagibius litoralis]|uniref:ABC transporter ATP-binding protein n=1 Tax=Pelagibius litoralis TaxID=374515 RepID=A0A967EY82_9PROT|nr:ABC transporter ATP-binding protein [Pelagibius litoralis]NIA69545.1 ABC transporter ATP-binding protein [Pelagibius litoralis]